MKISKRVFNFRLYVEGLKRLRVIGFGVLLLALTAAVMFCAVAIIEDYQALQYYSFGIKVEMLEMGEICYPLVFLPFIMPIFVLVMFSFLFKRKESDFYHALPFTRSCVYITYIASTLTWVWGITIATSTVSGILWAIHPYTSFLFSDLIVWMLLSCLSSTILCAFMALAVTSCGNMATTLLNFFVFTILPRMILVLLGLLLDSEPLLNVKEFCGGFFTLSWSLPLGLLEYAKFDFGIGMKLNNTALHFHTVIMSLVLFVLAGLFYKSRRSEMAGNSAVSSIMQNVFRCLFALPFALVATCCIFDQNIMTAFVLGVISLLAYYLYELITTRRLKNLLRATPKLTMVLVCCFLFAGGYQGIKLFVNNWKIEAEDIIAVDFDGLYYFSDEALLYERHKMEELLTFPLRVEDESIIDATANALEHSQKLSKENYGYYSACQVTLHLKNGLTVTRNIWTQDKTIKSYFLSFPEHREALLSLPKKGDISYIVYEDSEYEQTYLENKDNPYMHVKEYGIDSYDKRHVFYEIFYSEYQNLTEEEKIRIKMDSEELLKQNGTIVIRLEGYGSNEQFYSVYAVLPDLMPQAHAFLVDYFIPLEMLPQ